MSTRLKILFLLLVAVAGTVPFRAAFQRTAAGIVQVAKGKKTVAERIEQYGVAARKRLAPGFERIGFAYPPQGLVLAGFKHEKILEVWATRNGEARLLRKYPILAASGRIGPKLREGDRQVPEGIYRIESLNPNSLYHLSLRVNYPNPFDGKMAEKDGRIDLGGDIMIHGGNCSIGCLAMGDDAAEELFVLAAETGIENVSVVLSPVDFRIRKLPKNVSGLPEWTEELYARIGRELSKLAPDAE